MIDWAEVINSGGIFRDKMIFALTGKGKQKMLDREKVIKGLELLANWPDGLIFPDKEKWIKPCCERAVAMLKEQEAVEARKKSNGIPQPWASWWYVCGDCGQEIEYHDRFCRWCGRSVKWK